MLVTYRVSAMGRETKQSCARHDSAILGNWPHILGSMKLAAWPRTFVGKVAHLSRVYKMCHDTPYSRSELRTLRERNYK